MKIKFGELALLFAFGILLSAVWSNIAVSAQNKTAIGVAASTSSAKPEQHITKVKIISPTRGQQLPVGKDLTISGTSIDNATASSTDCKVSVIANKVKPYQPATATGTGGAADYSKWKFDITSKYTTIKPGENRITAKYECGNNAALTSFSSVNVTGVATNGSAATATNNTSSTTTTGATTKGDDITTAANNTTPTKPTATTTTTSPHAQTTTAGAAVAKQQQQQHSATTNSNNPTSASNNAAVSPVSNVGNKPLSSTQTSTIAPRVKAIDQQPQNQTQQMVMVSNNTDRQNSKLASPSPVITSDKLMYLGYRNPDITNNNDLTDKNTMNTKSASTRGTSSTTTDNGSSDKGSVVIKYRNPDITNNNDLTDKNTMNTKSANTIHSSIQHKNRDISTSHVNVNRNTDNVNNNFIFPFSYP